MATIVEQLEAQVSNLAPKDLAVFRAWYEEFDAKAWDEQIKRHAESGTLDKLAALALDEYSAGKTRQL